MKALDYCWADEDDETIVNQIPANHLFFWKGRCGDLTSKTLVVLAYLEWRKKLRNSSSIGSLLLFQDSFDDSGDVNMEDDHVIVGLDSNHNHNIDEVAENSNNGSNEWRKLKKYSDQIKWLLDHGRTYEDLLKSSAKNKEIQHLHAELIRHANNWRDYEAVVANQRQPIKIPASAPTPVMLRKYGLTKNDYNSYVMNTILKDFYQPHFVRGDPQKGEYILFLWSNVSSVGKTTFIKQGIENGCNQIVQWIQSEPNKWIQNWKPNTGTVNAIDGYTVDDKRNGINLSFFERVGMGQRCKINQRGLSTQPETNGEPLIVTSNSDYTSFFNPDECNKVLSTRIISIQLSKKHTLFPLTDLLREINGKPPLPAPVIRKPKHIRIPVDELKDNEDSE